jgi:hypothetical protein
VSSHTATNRPSRPRLRGVALNARIFLTAAAVAVLATPAGATAKPIPVKHPTPQRAKHIAKRHGVPRVLCICVPLPVGGIVPALTEVEVEARSDVQQIEDGLEPAYVSFQTTPESQAQYDAVLIANGLSPYFNTASRAQAASE